MIRIHCSYHKCLTVYFKRVLNHTLRYNYTQTKNSFLHCRSDIDKFYSNINNFTVISLNNRSLNLTDFHSKVKISRFIRDPRDLVVSGYFYHKRGAEDWTRIKKPTSRDWEEVNGNIPLPLKTFEGSYFDYLNEVSIEKGLLAELEFRKFHFQSMLDWVDDNEVVKTFKYEDIIGNERKTFKKIFQFYGFGLLLTNIGGYYAEKFAFKNMSKDKHVRNPKSGQWKTVFSESIERIFNQEYGILLEKLDYPYL